MFISCFGEKNGNFLQEISVLNNKTIPLNFVKILSHSHFMSSCNRKESNDVELATDALQQKTTTTKKNMDQCSLMKFKAMHTQIFDKVS